MTKRILTVLALATAIGLTIAFVPGHRGWFDIGVYHDAMVYWIRQHGDLYSFLRPGTVYGFTYPPFAAVCMAPMAYLGWYTTIAANLAVTVAASAFVLYLLVDPIARRRGWSRWYTLALAACAFAMLSPVRDTYSFGQVNLLLLALVYFDLLALEQGWRIAGIGIGLAAAIKLTPSIFILYLLVAGQRRAALRATLTALGATLLAAAVAPDATRAYFAEAVWDTGRVGSLAYISNQSLAGLVVRLGAGQVLWLALVLTVLAIFLFRVRATGRSADLRAGFALTGLAGCLISPVTWVHHLVWVIPALILAAERRRMWTAGICSFLLTTSLVWLWTDARGFIGFFGGNAYVLISLVLLLSLPIRPAVPQAQPAVPPQRVDPIDTPALAGSAATP
jgi:alpha-1,2-mannosyltransferase